MAFSALVYLVLAVISVLIAVLLFAKLWNVFIGGDTTQHDVNALAALIQKMANDDKQYEQQPFIMQLGTNGVAGFDTESSQILYKHYATDDQTTYTLDKPTDNTCKDKTCVCTVESDKIKNCITIAANGKTVLLGADYIQFLDFVTWHPGLFVEPAFRSLMSSVAQPFYSTFIVSGTLYNQQVVITLSGKSQSQATTSDTNANAVVTLTVEKEITEEGKVRILVMLESPYSRTRGFYLQQCSQGSAAAECRGVTGSKSVDNGVMLNGKKAYCAANEIDSSCKLRELPVCSGAITEPCLCGTVVKTFGACVDSNYYAITCDAVNTCADYCKLSDPASYRRIDINPGFMLFPFTSSIFLTSVPTVCTPSNLLCSVNPCGVDTGCFRTPDRVIDKVQTYACEPKASCASAGGTCVDPAGGCHNNPAGQPTAVDVTLYCAQQTQKDQPFVCCTTAAYLQPQQPTTPSDPCASVTSCQSYCPLTSPTTQGVLATPGPWCNTPALQTKCTQNQCNVAGGCELKAVASTNLLDCEPVTQQPDACSSVSSCADYCHSTTTIAQNGFAVKGNWCDTQASQMTCGQNQCNIAGGCAVKTNAQWGLQDCEPVSQQQNTCSGVTSCADYCGPSRIATGTNGLSGQGNWCDTQALKTTCTQNQCNIAGGCALNTVAPYTLQDCEPVNGQS